MEQSLYRCTCGYDNFDGSNYAVALWVCYYNFLRPHKFNSYRILNKVDMIESADTMPANGSCLFISVRKPLQIFNHCKLMHNLFLDFEPEAKSVTKSLILLALYSVVKQCYTIFADGKNSICSWVSHRRHNISSIVLPKLSRVTVGFNTLLFSYATLHYH